MSHERIQCVRAPADIGWAADECLLRGSDLTFEPLSREPRRQIAYSNVRQIRSVAEKAKWCEHSIRTIRGSLGFGLLGDLAGLGRVSTDILDGLFLLGRRQKAVTDGWQTGKTRIGGFRATCENRRKYRDTHPIRNSC